MPSAKNRGAKLAPVPAAPSADSGDGGGAAGSRPPLRATLWVEACRRAPSGAAGSGAVPLALREVDLCRDDLAAVRAETWLEAGRLDWRPVRSGAARCAAAVRAAGTECTRRWVVADAVRTVRATVSATAAAAAALTGAVGAAAARITFSAVRVTAVEFAGAVETGTEGRETDTPAACAAGAQPSTAARTGTATNPPTRSRDVPVTSTLL